MTKKPLAEEQELDEKIADFADKVLSMNEEIKINDAQPGEEFLQLQKNHPEDESCRSASAPGCNHKRQNPPESTALGKTRKFF